MPKHETKAPASETKGIFESKTVWGVILLILAAKLEDWTGVSVNEAAGADFLDSLLVVLGGAWAVFGRLKATRGIDDIF